MLADPLAKTQPSERQLMHNKTNGRARVSPRSIVLPLVALSSFGLSSPAGAQPSMNERATSAPSLYRVGKTGIHCYQAPCPWRGIVPLDAEGNRARWPIWSGEEPPALQGHESHRRQIATSWENDECLTVEGRFANATLQVLRIVGPC